MSLENKSDPIISLFSFWVIYSIQVSSILTIRLKKSASFSYRAHIERDVCEHLDIWGFIPQNFFSCSNRREVYNGRVHIVNMKYLVPQIFILAQFDDLTKSYHEMHQHFRGHTQKLAFPIGVHHQRKIYRFLKFAIQFIMKNIDRQRY